LDFLHVSVVKINERDAEFLAAIPAAPAVFLLRAGDPQAEPFPTMKSPCWCVLFNNRYMIAMSAKRERFATTRRPLKENEPMTGIQYVTDEKGRKVGVLIDLKKHGAIWEDFWDGLVSESRRKEKGIPYEQYRATRLKRTRPRA
jgi:hypothetical protein